MTKCGYAITGLAMLAGVSLCGGAEYYVATNGSGSGTSWSAAYTTIQAALDAAGDNDTIHIAGQTFVLAGRLTWTNRSGMTLVGGYAATNDSSLPGANDPVQWPTRLTRTATTNRLCYVSGVVNSELRGVTVSDGYLVSFVNHTAEYGAGLHITGASQLGLISCTIASNVVQQATSYADGIGAGLYVAAGSSVMVSNSLVAHNELRLSFGDIVYGGGAAVYGDAVFQDCTFMKNAAKSSSDSYGFGGALFCNGSIRLANCLLIENDARAQGDAIRIVGGTVSLENCTVADHLDSGVHQSAGMLSISNSIIWNCGDDLVGAAMLAYSDVEDGDGHGANGCISVDPGFEYGFYLAADSACIDAGGAFAGDVGLSARTTRANGELDSGIVDLGYHPLFGADLNYADLYVDAGAGDDGNAGTNAAAPLATITHALSKAMDSSRIHVAPGVYTNGAESFPLTISGIKGVRLLGTDRETTVVDAGNSSRRVLSILAAARTRIEGLQLTGGDEKSSANHVAAKGGGVYIENSGPVDVVSCLIWSNKARGVVTYADAVGGGVHIDAGSAVVLSDCLVISNTASGSWGDVFQGGGVAVFGQAVISNCVIASNTVLAASQPYGTGGGIYGAGSLLLRNCLLHGNSSKMEGDAVRAAGGAVQIENCTIAHHPDDGICQSGAALVSVSNSIVWECGDDMVGTVTLGYSNIQDGDSNTINGCISADPLFVNPNIFDYSIGKASPCVNQGLNQAWMAGQFDLAGNERIRGTKVDMGAYETPASSGTIILIL